LLEKAVGTVLELSDALLAFCRGRKGPQISVPILEATIPLIQASQKLITSPIPPVNLNPASLPKGCVIVVKKSELEGLEEKDSTKTSEADVAKKENGPLDNSAPIPPVLPELDDQHPDYAEELDVAIAAWNYLYRDANKLAHHSHKSAFDIWAKANAEGFGPTARKRIRAVCNPSANKNGGESWDGDS